MRRYPFHIYFSLSCLLPVLNTGTATEFPQSEISNGIIHARIYWPDAEKGYYRGTRFDWSGVIPSLEFDHHTYCEQWFEKYDPTTHDAIMGPVESFDPLGFTDANPDGSFVQIGVGVLLRPDGAPYSPFRYYRILNHGSWKVKHETSTIEFVQTLRDSNYSYQYKKSVILLKDRPVLVLTHRLKNTGKRPIRTSVYDHNLFVFDHQSTGPFYTLKFPFILSADTSGQRGMGKGSAAVLEDRQIQFNRTLSKADHEQVYSILTGYGDSARDYDIEIENHRTGAAVRITGDRPIARLVFWGAPAIFSPEPYIRIEIQPDEVFTWTISYEFYTCVIK